MLPPVAESVCSAAATRHFDFFDIFDCFAGWEDFDPASPGSMAFGRPASCLLLAAR
jgi:hypothetical protein